MDIADLVRRADQHRSRARDHDCGTQKQALRRLMMRSQGFFAGKSWRSETR
jgi:hypothetical protein